MTARAETVLVVGATGRTGRHVVDGLLRAGVSVRALVRQPAMAQLPDGVTVIEGALQDTDAVRSAATGADAAFLLWMGDDAAEVHPAVEALTSQVGHVVYLSAADLHRDDSVAGAVQAGIYAVVEQALEDSGRSWTFLRGGGFAANTLMWAEQIRSGEVVAVLHPDAARSVVDERDLAEVAVRALLDPGLAGRSFTLTGPKTLSQAEQLAIIGAVLGRELVVREQDAEEVRAEWSDLLGPEFADRVIEHAATLADRPEPVTGGIDAVLGRPGRTYEDWVRLHRADFEAGS